MTPQEAAREAYENAAKVAQVYLYGGESDMSDEMHLKLTLSNILYCLEKLTRIRKVESDE